MGLIDGDSGYPLGFDFGMRQVDLLRSELTKKSLVDEVMPIVASMVGEAMGNALFVLTQEIEQMKQELRTELLAELKQNPDTAGYRKLMHINQTIRREDEEGGVYLINKGKKEEKGGEERRKEEESASAVGNSREEVLIQMMSEVLSRLPSTEEKKGGEESAKES